MRLGLTIGLCRNFTGTLERYETEELLLHHAHCRSTGIRRAQTRRNRERRSVLPVVCGADGQPAAVPGLPGILNKVCTAPLNQCAVMCSLALLPRYVSVPVTSLPT